MKKNFKFIFLILFVIGLSTIMPAYADFNEHFNLGQNYIAQQQYSSAIMEFQKALKIDPYNDFARIELINSYLASGTDLANNKYEYQAAADDYKSAIFYLKYYVNNDIAKNWSDSIRATKKKLSFCEKRAKVKNNSENHYLMADKLYKNKNYSAAAYEYEQIINKKKYKREALFKISTIMEVLNNKEQCDEYYNKAIGNDVFHSELDFRPYMKELQQKIKSNWNPPKDSIDKKVILLFKINKKGELMSCEVYKSSGSINLDQSAIEAVKQAAPFNPLPSNYKKENIDIQFIFDYYALND